jgi:hydrogenase nickel incorporation protein HypA/HybF
MHEYSIIQSLVARVEAEVRARGASSVQRVEVDVGELAGVEVPLLVTAYDSFRARTLLAGADLAVRLVPACWRCSGCGADVTAGGWLRCTACGAPARLIEGDEIVLRRIEMEIPDV